jgi:mRNA-degrading endonuclease toxin of MazEF toxin-antitoxin module
MTMKRGDVVLVRFPRSDLRSWDRRPALVMQADALAAALPQVVLSMITSNKDVTCHSTPCARRPAPLLARRLESSNP